MKAVWEYMENNKGYIETGDASDLSGNVGTYNTEYVRNQSKWFDNEKKIPKDFEGK